MLPRPETPRGIGGSLLVFLISCAVAAAVAMTDVFSAWQALTYFEEKLGHPLSFGFMWEAWVLSGSRALVPLGVIVLMLLVRRRLVVGVAIAAFWFAFVILPALNVLRMFADPFRLPDWVPLAFWPLGFGLAFCVAVTAYLLRSRRVAATFRRPIDVAGVFD